ITSFNVTLSIFFFSICFIFFFFFFFSSRRRHTRWPRDWSSDVCSSDLAGAGAEGLLVFGERLDGHLPEERARSVHGVDPETVLRSEERRVGKEGRSRGGGEG